VTEIRATLSRLATAVRLAWTARPVLLVAYLATSVLAGVIPVATVWLAKVAVDQVSAGAGGAALWAVGIALAAVGLGVAVIPAALAYIQAELGRSVSVRAKDELYRAVTGIPLLRTLEVPSFRDRLRLAEQASRSGPGQVVDAGVGLVQATLTLTGMVGAVAIISPGVAAVLLAAAVPALVAEIRLSRQRAEMAWRISPAERRELFYTELLTNLSAAKEIRLFGISRLFRRRMLAELETSNAEQRRFDRREGATQIVLAALSAVLAGGALVWVLFAASRGQLTVGDVTAVILAVGSVQSALAGAVNHVANGYHAGLLLDHYRALVSAAEPAGEPDRSPSSAAVQAAARGPGGPRGVELRDVWFRYADDLPWVLRGVSMTIPESQAVAIVGENGSGKSTLVKLLCRFYDPTRGSIRWDGVDLRDLPLDELHRRVGAVFQDFMTYDLTAEENIALGDVDGHDELDLSPARIEDAAGRAEMHEALVALPRGYRTLLSREFASFGGDEPDGVVLSGGQWQRLALARALLRGRRDLLILDEPSSGLDAEAEHRIHHAIRHYRRGRTSVLVSHRLNAVRDADRIMVLADGQVVELGDHDSLMSAGGTYARMFRLQAAGYETAPAP
jgi:ATP-binding cassette subfamily B protein